MADACPSCGHDGEMREARSPSAASDIQLYWVATPCVPAEDVRAVVKLVHWKDTLGRCSYCGEHPSGHADLCEFAEALDRPAIKGLMEVD